MTLKAWQRPGVLLASGSAATSRSARSTAAKINVNGSSLAAGHPFGATGGRIVATLAKLLARARLGPRADLDLRRGRPGRLRDPGEARMSDRYQSLTNSPLGRGDQPHRAADPAGARRHEPGKPVVAGPVLLGGAHGGRLLEPRRPR